MSLVDMRVSDIHVTTLVTYLIAFAVTIYLGRKQRFSLSDMVIYAGGVMVLAVVSFEVTWLSLESLLTTSSVKLSLSSVFIDLSILAVTGLAVYRMIGRLSIDRLVLLLSCLTIFLWLSWLPSFALNSGSRAFADPIKLFQTGAIVLGFRPRLPAYYGGGSLVPGFVRPEKR